MKDNPLYRGKNASRKSAKKHLAGFGMEPNLKRAMGIYLLGYDVKRNPNEI